MSADERWPGDEASRQVEDRIPAQGQGGYAAGSEGAGSEVWDREPAGGLPRGAWVGTRGGERERARRRVEQNPEVMPPHPMPVDRHGYKPEAHEVSTVARRALPVAALFFAGLALARLVGPQRRAWRTAAAPQLVLALRARGRRNRRAARQLVERLRGSAFRGVIAFE